MPHPGQELDELRASLISILRRTFDPGGLRRFISLLPSSSVLIPELPGDHAGLAELVHAFVDTGIRHGIFDEAFIERLAEERPRWRSEIESLRTLVNRTHIAASNALHSVFEMRLRFGRLIVVISLGLGTLVLLRPWSLISESFRATSASVAPDHARLPLPSSSPVMDPPAGEEPALSVVECDVDGPEWAVESSVDRIDTLGSCTVTWTLVNFTKADTRAFRTILRRVDPDCPHTGPCITDPVDRLVEQLERPLGDVFPDARVSILIGASTESCDLRFGITQPPRALRGAKGATTRPPPR